jgi:hypothetical protein
MEILESDLSTPRKEQWYIPGKHNPRLHVQVKLTAFHWIEKFSFPKPESGVYASNDWYCLDICRWFGLDRCGLFCYTKANYEIYFRSTFVPVLSFTIRFLRFLFQQSQILCPVEKQNAISFWVRSENSAIGDVTAKVSSLMILKRLCN